MTTNIPQHFDEAFLSWFQERTEETWRRYKTKTFEEFVAGGSGGSDWQRGTRWLGGLSEQEIAVIEQRYDLRFPADYRLFLRVLHSVDRPCVGARYVDSTMIPVTRPSFYNWQMDAEIQAAYERLFEGLFFRCPARRSVAAELGNKAEEHGGTEGPPARAAARCAQTDPCHRTSLSAGRTMRRRQSGPVGPPIRYDYLRP